MPKIKQRDKRNFQQFKKILTSSWLSAKITALSWISWLIFKILTKSRKSGNLYWVATLENIRLNFPIFDPPPPMFVCLFNMYSPAPQRTFALVSYPSPPPPMFFCLFNMYPPAPPRTFALGSYPPPPPPPIHPRLKKSSEKLGSERYTQWR